MTFSEELLKAGAAVWTRTQEHPFVRGIGDGTLPVERFRFYIRQDYLFLIEYARVLALAVARGQGLPVMGRLAEVLHATLTTEMALHRSYCAELGITADDLEATAAAPTTYAYTRHLLAVAWSGGLGEILASLFPCQWGYWEIARALAARGEPPGAPLYARWIRTYTSPEYGELAAWMRDLLDRLGEAASPPERERMRGHFLTSSRLELAFWEMSWRMETWPV